MASRSTTWFRAQLAPFVDLIGFRISVHGPKVRLKAACAQAVGLALHELTTNAGKYGARSDGSKSRQCLLADRHLHHERD
jgi:two-component sensor histidine kinase